MSRLKIGDTRITDEVCEQFNNNIKNNIYVNPLTKRKIQKDGPTYEALDLTCLAKQPNIQPSFTKKQTVIEELPTITIQNRNSVAAMSNQYNNTTDNRIDLTTQLLGGMELNNRQKIHELIEKGLDIDKYFIDIDLVLETYIKGQYINVETVKYFLKELYENNEYIQDLTYDRIVMYLIEKYYKDGKNYNKNDYDNYYDLELFNIILIPNPLDYVDGPVRNFKPAIKAATYGLYKISELLISDKIMKIFKYRQQELVRSFY